MQTNWSDDGPRPIRRAADHPGAASRPTRQEAGPETGIGGPRIPTTLTTAPDRPRPAGRPPDPGPGAGPPPIDAALWRLAAVLLLGPILALLDTTIVSVGLHSVAQDLGSPLSTLQWVSTGYLLSVALAMPLTGWAAQRFGGRAVWTGSVALFTAGSALCGLAWSVPALIAFRVLQGLGGGMIQPVGQAMLAQAAGPGRLGRVIAVSMVPVTLAPVLGPVLGGIIVQHFDWRWMFYVNVPVGLVTLLLAARILPRAPADRDPRARLDVLGLLLLSPALAALVYGCSERRVALVAAGALLLAGYGVHAARGGGRVPLIDVGMFARRGFAAATASSFLLGGSLYSAMLLLPLYFQQVRGADAMSAGLMLAPQAAGTAAVSLLTGRITDRVGPRPLMLCGLALALLGTVPLALLGHGPDPAPWLMATALVIRGAGLGLALVPGMSAVFVSVSRSDVPRAAGTVNVLNRLGGSLGTAVLTGILERSMASGRAPSAAFGTAFLWSCGLALLAFVPACFYPAGNARSSVAPGLVGKKG